MFYFDWDGIVKGILNHAVHFAVFILPPIKNIFIATNGRSNCV